MKAFKALSTWGGLLVFISVSALVLYFESNRHEANHLHISVSPWVGFTPIAYAQEKGWIDTKSFKFSWHVDMNESAKLYERQLIDGFLSTQYEVLHLNVDNHYPKPVLLIDAPSSDDVILSNYTLMELSDYKKEVLVYLPNHTVNKKFIHHFININQLSHVKFKFINNDLHTLPRHKNNEVPVVIVSYAPYSAQLIANGYKLIDANNTVQSFRFVDALFINESLLSNRADDIEKLKVSIEKARKFMMENPREFYEVVRPYLEGQSYEEFTASIEDLEWANEKNYATLANHLRSNKIDTSFLKL